MNSKVGEIRNDGRKEKNEAEGQRKMGKKKTNLPP